MDLKRIDAHSHVNLRAYAGDHSDVVRRALEQGTGMLAVGTDKGTSAAAVAQAEKYEGVWAVVGLHPNNLVARAAAIADESEETAAETFDPAVYRALAAGSRKVVAIGECGLDYYRIPPEMDAAEVKRTQKDALHAQFDLALELGLPVMLHCREAHEDLANILERYADEGRPLTGNVHCFTGTWAEAERYLALGMFLSFTGVITYKPRAADIASGETLQDVVRKVPLERMLIETDAPWLAPVPHRGERNEPAWVSEVAAKIAELKGLSVEEVEQVTLGNTRRLFKLS
ncbi:MAG: hypothetical protein RLZZ324_945 [Candidatus Parcubacteria bacterium]|jgi:TatD DNase family protein